MSGTSVENKDIPSNWSKLLPYAQLHVNACTGVSQNHDIQAALVTIGKILEHPTVELLARLCSKDISPKELLDLGIRLYTGCYSEKNRTQAMICWVMLTGENIPGKFRARGFSCLASYEMDTMEETPGVWNIDALYRSADYANQAAGLGFVSSSVLFSGQKVDSAGFRRLEDCKFKEHSTERFEKLTDLWTAYDRRAAEIEQEDQKREGKVVLAPQLYYCAAPDCGIEGTHKSALKKCAGKCTEKKPSYCSKECQREDWKRHKPFCKAIPDFENTEPEIYRATEMSNASVGAAGENTRTDGKEYRVGIPGPGGASVTMSSTTMTPAFMKDVRRALKEIVEERA